MALLAYLAVAGADGRSLRRDTLLALFWPELPNARARAALRQVLFRVRRILGAGALRTDRESVSLAPGTLRCDVVAFEQALAEGDAATALELYRGDLLEGFYVDGMSGELETWMERERARLKRRALRVGWTLAEEAERSHDPVAATTWARRAVALEPDDEIVVRRLIELLDRCGDQAGALRAAADLARRMGGELGSRPSAETRKLVDEIRSRGNRADAPGPKGLGASESARPVSVGGAIAAGGRPAAEPTAVAAKPAGPARPPAGRRPALAAAVIAVGLVTVGGGLLLGARSGRGAAPAVTGPPSVTIASPVARRLYEEGLGRYYAGDEREAGRLLHAALAEDGSCAMCAYFASLADARYDDKAAVRMLRLAMSLAGSVSEPERLFIHYGWADAANSPTRLAIAESLAVRYRPWPEAQLALGQSLWMAGDYIGAVLHLRSVISSDSARTGAASGDCPACTAEWLLVNLYKAADSLPTAVEVARAWVRASPHSRNAWLELSNALAGSGRYDEARAALDSSTAHAAGERDEPIGRAQIEIRAGNFAVADGLLRTVALTGRADSRADALWWLVISLRQQGRLREALAMAKGPLLSAERESTLASGAALVAQGQVLFELGHYPEAAADFEARARSDLGPEPVGVGNRARRLAWFLTQAGSALAAAGDTVSLAALADTVQAWGGQSGLARDRWLHEYLRGLLWMARKRPEEAVAAFRRAVVSETEGFSRLDLELASALLALDRPDEAVTLLRHALSGSIEGGNYYATRTELQELLARAFDRAAEPDSATAYYARVARAWRSADPPLQSRAARAGALGARSGQPLATRP